MDTCADDGLYDDGFPSIGCNSASQYFDYTQSVFHVSNAFGARPCSDSISDDEREMVRDSVMSILESDSLSEESVVVLADILQIGFQVEAHTNRTLHFSRNAGATPSTESAISD